MGIATISFVRLSAVALGIPLVVSLDAFVGEIETLFDTFLFSILEPYVSRVVEILSAALPFRIQLDPRWKQAFVLLNLYFGHNFWQFAREAPGALAKGHLLSTLAVAASAGVLGLVVATSVSVASGVVPHDSALEGNSVSAAIFALLFASLPVVGFVVYSIALAYPLALWQLDLINKNTGRQDTRSQLIQRYRLSALERLAYGMYIAIGVVVLNSMLESARLPHAPSAGLLAVIVLVACLAEYWRRRGEKQASERAAQSGEDIELIRRQIGNIRLGTDMWKVLLVAAATLTGNLFALYLGL